MKIILHIWSSCDPVIPLREILPRKTRAYVHRKTCIMFIASLITKWKQAISEWINQMSYVHTVKDEVEC